MASLKRPLLLALLPGVLLLAGFAAHRLPTVDSHSALAQAGALPVTMSAETRIGLLQKRVRQLPAESDGYLALGEAYLERARDTANPAYYDKADLALRLALATGQDEHGAIATSLGSLALARHRFREAEEWGRRALERNPSLPAAYGVLGDSLLELGGLPEAVAAYQQMVDRKPDLAALARVSHVREVTGDVEGAITAMRRAANAGGTGTAAAWGRTQLGDLLWKYQADAAGAGREYGAALAASPGYGPALAGQARLEASRGDLNAAISLARHAEAALPSLELAVLTADLLHAAGRSQEVVVQEGVIRAMVGLMDASGVEADAEALFFEADRGNDTGAVVDNARALYEMRPGPRTAEALAWALHKDGRTADARPFMREALEPGTREPVTHFRAAAVGFGCGDFEAAAAHLAVVTASNPVFSIRYAASVERLRQDLAGGLVAPQGPGL